MTWSIKYIAQNDFHVTSLNFGETRRDILRKWCFIDVTSRILGGKTAIFLELPERKIWNKTQKETPNDTKLKTAKWPPEIFQFPYCNTKKIKFQFFKHKCHPTLKPSKKLVYYETHKDKHACHISKQYPSFAVQRENKSLVLM